jgi:tripartite-type tricarboxylate transporter receptor subunit TctC
MSAPLCLSRRRLLLAGAAAATTLPFASSALAQAWPSKPIKFIVTFPPGGLTDLYARAYGDYIAQKTGQPVVVENKGGAGGIIGAQTAKSSAPDGYTFMWTISSTMFMNRVLYKTLPYDPDKDFVPVSSMSGGGLYFIVQKSLGVKTLAEFFEHAKKNKVVYGTYSAGSESHMAISELNTHYGSSTEIVHYRGAGPLWIDFNANVVHAASGTYPTSRAAQESGQGVPLALWSTKRSSILPNVPTYLELGFKNPMWSLQGFVACFALAGTPPDVIAKISSLCVEAGKGERIAKLLKSSGIDESAISHDAFRKLYDYEKPIWLEQVTRLGLTPQ